LSSVVEIGYQGITINIANTDRAKNPLSQDRRVRQAFEAALDRQAIVQVVYNGEFAPGNQWVSPTNFYYDKKLPVPGRDLAKANSLLKEAGVATPVVVNLMVTNSPDAMQVGQVIQAMTKEAGFDVRLQTTEFASSLQAAQKGDFEAFLIGWSGRPDPDGNLHSFVTCKGPLNDGKYCNPDVDRLVDLTRTVSEPSERKKFYDQVADLTLKDLPIIYLYHRQWFWAYTNKLGGLREYPDGMIRVHGLKYN
jgi:peptide/nickel transport system substrate-binding protein